MLFPAMAVMAGKTKLSYLGPYQKNKGNMFCSFRKQSLMSMSGHRIRQEDVSGGEINHSGILILPLIPGHMASLPLWKLKMLVRALGSAIRT